MKLLSTWRESSRRATCRSPPISAATRRINRHGTGNRRLFLPIANASRRMSSGVDTSSPSLTRNVLPAAAGWLRQVAMASTRLPTKIRLRRLSTLASGSGQALAARFISCRKLASTLGPYTSGGRINTTSMLVDSAASAINCSATSFDRPYASKGAGASASRKGVVVVCSPLTLIELRNTKRRTPQRAAARANWPLASPFTAWRICSGSPPDFPGSRASPATWITASTPSSAMLQSVPALRSPMHIVCAAEGIRRGA